MTEAERKLIIDYLFALGEAVASFQHDTRQSRAEAAMDALREGLADLPEEAS